MRKVVASIFVTVDGVVEDPGGAEGFDLGGWSSKYGGRSDDDLQHAGDLLRGSDASGLVPSAQCAGRSSGEVGSLARGPSGIRAGRRAHAQRA